MSDDNTRLDLYRRGFLTAAGAAAGGAALTGVTSATPGRSPGAKEDEVLVGVSAAADEVAGEVAKHVPGNAEVVHVNGKLRYVAVKFPSQASEVARENFIEAITSNRHVKYAETNETFESLEVPNDPRYDDQYADQMVNAPTAWDTTYGDSSVTVAVVDQGVKYDHPDLDGNVGSDEGHDFVDSDSDPYPDSMSDEYHGTHVAGIAAAETNNGEGVSGIGNSTVLSGRALSESGSGSTADIADAIQWAADQGADVINLSLGGGDYTSTMKNAVSYATDNGSLVVAAAGNDGSGSVSYPAAYSECLAVSALDPDESLASYSNYGSDIELAAPGTNVLSTWTDDGYDSISGTSMATPVVAGVAGLTLAAHDLTNAELRDHLKATAADVGLSSDEQGSGRVDAGDAVTTEPGDGGGGDGSTTSSVSGSLSGYWDGTCYSYGFEYSDPSRVVLELEGPSNADFDLYANDGTGSCPSTSSYDYRSWSTDSQETIAIDDPDTSTELHLLVDSYSGSGSYTVTITEYE
ncbi:S8 family serine peptidase [Halorarum halophilum]|uniref:S8 family serine peptidase n=1 Tax=Halorarum halophilum TaxID=2743090 RepID=A0A7D5KBN1_9EURY|nr:S8 family serine peptidase [Halobaculum halophilum]QLG26077.1 S8 family serine peptidase [Halobaculum halophilum]